MPSASLFPQKQPKENQKSEKRWRRDRFDRAEDVMYEPSECVNERKEVQGGEEGSVAESRRVCTAGKKI